MRNMLLAVLLTLPGLPCGADTVIPQTRGLASRVIDWRDQKDAVKEMNEKLKRSYSGRYSADDYSNLCRTLDKIWSLLETVEAKSVANRDFMLEAISRKQSAGSMDRATADDLRTRTRIIMCARMYYLYGNMYSRVIEEGFGELRPPLRSVLGEGLELLISDEQLKAFTASWDYDPAKYGLPKPPDIDVHD